MGFQFAVLLEGGEDVCEGDDLVGVVITKALRTEQQGLGYLLWICEQVSVPESKATACLIGGPAGRSGPPLVHKINSRSAANHIQ